MLLVPEFHLHSHILAVPSSPALLPLSWFIVIFHLDESLLAGFSTSVFSHLCPTSGFADEARMGDGGLW